MSTWYPFLVSICIQMDKFLPLLLFSKCIYGHPISHWCDLLGCDALSAFFLFFFLTHFFRSLIIHSLFFLHGVSLISCPLICKCNSKADALPRKQPVVFVVSLTSLNFSLCFQKEYVRI
jgi:hypothetical protein